MKKTREELKQLAIALYERKLFTSEHVEDKGDLSTIFLPLPLGKLSNLSEEEIADIGLLYEFKEKASPGERNGYPVFTTMDYLTHEETRVMYTFLAKYTSMKKALERDAEEVTTELVNQ